MTFPTCRVGYTRNMWGNDFKGFSNPAWLQYVNRAKRAGTALSLILCFIYLCGQMAWCVCCPAPGRRCAFSGPGLSQVDCFTLLICLCIFTQLVRCFCSICSSNVCLYVQSIRGAESQVIGTRHFYTTAGKGPSSKKQLTVSIFVW